MERFKYIDESNGKVYLKRLNELNDEDLKQLYYEHYKYKRFFQLIYINYVLEFHYNGDLKNVVVKERLETPLNIEEANINKLL